MMDIQRRVPAQRYSFSDEDIETALEQIGTLLRTRSYLTNGDYVAEFERCFAAYTGTRHAVATNSGSAALEIILRAIGIDGKEVIVPTNTFAATAFAVMHAGGTPVFADCDDDLQADVSDVIRRITTRTAAVIVVHIGGCMSARLAELRTACADAGVALVEDAAHAHGSRLGGRQPGSYGVAAAYSFFSTKVMTTGEGGMIVTDDAEIAVLATQLRDHGKEGGANLHRRPGGNWRMPEIAAILGLAQLRRLDEHIASRGRVASIYATAFSDSPRLRPLPAAASCQPNFYKFVLVADQCDVGQVKERLARDHGVALGGFVYDIPCHLQPVFADRYREALPRAEHLCRHHLCPPIYPDLTDDTARYVADALLQMVSR